MRTLVSRLPPRARQLRNCTVDHTSRTSTKPIWHDRETTSHNASTFPTYNSTAHERIQHPSPRLSTPAILALHPTQPRLKQMPQKPKPPPDEEFEEYFLKGSGPGGQKINKTNSAVQLLHKSTGIVVKSQATRSRSQNRTIARQLLADKLDHLEKGDKSRAAIVGSVKAKKKASSAKKARRKYRKLEEEKAEAAAATAEDQPREERGPRASTVASENSQQQVENVQMP